MSKRYRSSITGKLVSKAFAAANPATTTGETVRPRSAASKLLSSVKKLIKDLPFTGGESSESAPFEIFNGKRAERVTGEVLLKQIRRTGADFQERSAAIFFTNLITNAETQDIAQRLGQLHSALADNLRDLKVFAVGRIQIDIYVVGTSSDGILYGVKTKSVET